MTSLYTYRATYLENYKNNDLTNFPKFNFEVLQLYSFYAIIKQIVNFNVKNKDFGDCPKFG